MNRSGEGNHLAFRCRIWKLKKNLAAYDASYVSLAEALDATLITGDQNVKSVAGYSAKVQSCLAMNVEQQIEAYLLSQTEPKRGEMQTLHRSILEALPGCQLWFSDGKNGEGKIVSNPNVGYGSYTIKYADGTTKEFFRIGLSGNTTGISIYVMGLEDKAYLQRTLGNAIGKASVTGYCIKFKKLIDIDADVLLAVIKKCKP